MGYVKSYKTAAINLSETCIVHRTWLAGAVVCLVMTYLLGCGIESGQKIAESHEWYRPPQNAQNDMAIVAGELVFPVHSAALEEAILDLEPVASIQLSPRSVAYYVQRDIPIKLGLRPFLVRAFGRNGSRFTVRQSPSALWIDASGGDGQVKSQPLVILVDPTPINVFVTMDYEMK